ncbi:MAG: glycosyltransferase [Oceanospirillales bacterium]|nr:glycosyltransferase [Oceanospirillales bacterium]
MNEQTIQENSSLYFSIVVPAYNEEEHIGSCLQSIFNSDYDSTQYEVIIVDNGSQDKTYEIAISSARARVFQLFEGNVGAVRNYGAAKARGQILIFVDADCLMDKDWLNRAEKLIKDKPYCAYGGGVKLPSDATWIETSWLLEDSKGRPTLPKHLIGASTMLSKELFLKTGGFNELVSSGEDTDLHNRLNSINAPVCINHELDVTHLGNAKTPMQFIRRQIWHSENYISNFSESSKDPIFIATLSFIILPIFALLQIFFIPIQKIIIITLLSWALIPALLSLKRISRTGSTTLIKKNILLIYLLDVIYITGRSLGLLKGLASLLKLRPYKRT